MTTRFTLATGGMLAALVLAWVTTADHWSARGAEPDPSLVGRRKPGFEVWIADQSDTRPGFGGQLLIYEGRDLLRERVGAPEPIARLDLGASTADLCRAATGRNPVRPHMILFNTRQTHAILSFVASGHVVIFDAQAREPLTCFETTVGSTGTRQAHAAFPAPDGSYVLVANQNGKRLERIDTDFKTNTFRHNAAATLDLMTCTTPSGLPCEHPDLRPINWPICPIIDSSSRYGFVTLRGGGLFVVDAKTTPMTIVGEYDKETVKGNGCGGLEVAGNMYINSGGSPVNVSSGDPHHPALYGFDVYRFPVAVLEERHVGFTRHRGKQRQSLPLGDGSTRGRRGDHRGEDRRAGEHGESGGRAERQSGAGSRRRRAVRGPLVRVAARPAAAQRRPAQCNRKHAGSRHHPNDPRRTEWRLDHRYPDDQSQSAARAGARPARLARSAPRLGGEGNSLDIRTLRRRSATCT
jgi:hypothetical protein